MLDKTQLETIVDLMVGEKPIGVDCDGNEVAVPRSPEMQAFVKARLGDLTPRGGWDIVGKPTVRSPERAKAFAALLREVADGIAPEVRGAAAYAASNSADTKTLKDLIGAAEMLIVTHANNPRKLVDSLIAEIRVAKECLS